MLMRLVCHARSRLVAARWTNPDPPGSVAGFLFSHKKGTFMAELAAGQKAPEIVQPLAEGREWRLSDQGGRMVVLYFYPKDDTSGCTVEAMDFTRLMPDFIKAGATVVGISPDSLKSHAKFAAKHALTHDLVSDEDKQAAQAYGVWAEKSMYGRKYMGVSRSTFLVGPDGTLLKVWRDVKVPGHAQAVLEAVQEAAHAGTA